MYDIIYIGGGLNYAGAVIASREGKKVALFEKDLNQLGGVCLHKGCIPSKMFLHYSNIIRQSKSDILNGALTIDMQKLIAQKEALLNNATTAIKKQCANIDLIEAKAEIIAPNKVKANGKIYEAKYIIIGTGSSPFIPNGIDYNKKDIITSDEVLMLQDLPKEIAIYGAGAIALEMATFFANVGVEVTIINRSNKWLKRANEFISTQIKKELQKLNITLLEEHQIKSAKSTKKGVHIIFENDKSIYKPMLLVATGRVANIDAIKTDLIKIKNSAILTDEYFETTLKNHYAIGDCNGKVQLAHAARAEVLNVTNRILNKKPKVLNLNNVVKFINTLPMSYATVGLNAYMLEKNNIPYTQSIVTLNRFTYSYYNDAIDGVMISYIDKDGFILGAEILSPHAQELIATIAMSLAGEMDKNQAKETIFAHPTFSEALERTFFKL